MACKMDKLFTKTSRNISNSVNLEAEEKLNWEWYNLPEKSIPVSFCMGTSLHGLKYLGEQKRHIFERLFWVIAFICSLVSSVFLIWGIWSDYRDMPIVTVFNPTEIKLDEIPFPGVTICNVNGIKKSTFDQHVNKVIRNGIREKANRTQGGKSKMSRESLSDLAILLDMSHICDSTLSFTDRFVRNVSVLNSVEVEVMESLVDDFEEVEKFVDPISTLKEVQISPPCSEMILHCVWLAKVIDCDKLFRPVETDYGSCCTFNSMPASLLLEKNFERPTKRNKSIVKEWEIARLDYGNLMFTKKTKNRTVPYRQRYPGRSAGLSFLLDPDLDDYFCTNADSEGFIMGANVPLDFPRMKDNGVAIPTNAEVFVGLVPEVTMSRESVRDFPTEKRQCYFGNEYELPHYSTYTVSNCMDECIARKTKEECGCKTFYMPSFWNDTECSPNKYECMDDVRRDIIENGISESCSECLPTCTEINYQKELTFLKLQEKKVQRMFAAVSSNKSNSKSYAARNVSIVHVYFSEKSVHPKLRKEVSSLIGLIWGLLGLCMGFSVLSLLEIVYYGSLRICCDFYRDKILRNQNLETNLVNVKSENDDFFHPQGHIIHPKRGCFFQIINEINRRILATLRRKKS